MEKSELAKIIINSIQKYGTNFSRNKFLFILGTILHDGLNYSNIKQNNMNIFQSMINDGDVNLYTNSDLDPLKLDSYWNQPNMQSFTYTVRILPEIHRRFPDSYKKVFDGSHLLPAGLDQKDNPNVNTIWNVVEEIDSNKEEENSFDKLEEKEKINLINKELKQIDNTTSFSTDQLQTVSKFLSNYLKNNK